MIKEGEVFQAVSDTGNIGKDEINNLMYEIDSAKRQIAALQGLLKEKTKDAAAMRAQMIEREVVLAQAAVCINEAIKLCRQQTDDSQSAYKYLKRYEEEWEILERRMRKVQEELPEFSVSEFIPEEGYGCLDKVRGKLECSVKEAEEYLKRLFEG